MGQWLWEKKFLLFSYAVVYAAVVGNLLHLKALASDQALAESIFWWTVIGCALLGLNSAMYLFETAEIEISWQRQRTRIADEINQLNRLRELMTEELKDSDGKETMLGAFIYGKSSILADDSICCVVANPDYEDNEFDSLYIIKRKSTPADEIIRATHGSL